MDPHQTDGSLHETQLLNFLITTLTSAFGVTLAETGNIDLDDLYEVLVGATSNGPSISALCDRSDDAPSGNNVLYHIRTKFDLDSVKAVGNTLLQEYTLSVLSEQVEVVADLHLGPYYGNEADTDGLFHSEAKAGTTAFHVYATLSARVRNKRYTVAVRRLTDGTKRVDYIQEDIHSVEIGTDTYIACTVKQKGSMAEPTKGFNETSDVPLVYSVVVNYDGFDDLADCIPSLLTMNYSNHEVIIVHNNNRFEAINELRQEYPNCINTVTGENLGFSKGFNIGIEHALIKGADYVLLLNSDVILDSAFLSEAVTVAERRTDTGIVGGKIYYYDEGRTETIWAAGGHISWFAAKGRARGCNEQDTGQYDEVESVGFIAGTQMLVNRDLFDNIGLLPEEFFLGGEEWDFCLSAKRAGYDILFVPSAILWHKVGHTGTDSYSRYYNLYRNKLIFMQRALPTPVWWIWYTILVVYAFTLARIRYQLQGPLTTVSGMQDAVIAHLRSEGRMTRQAFERARKRDKDQNGK